MAFQPFISKPNIQAVALATVVYGLLYMIFIATLRASMPQPTLVMMDSGLWSNRFFMTICGLAQYVLPGLLVGYLAKKSPMMHGYLLGIATTVMVYAYASFAYSDTPAQLPSSYTILYTCFVAGVWCSLGAVIADHVSNQETEE
ncbi:hypothetical protein ACO0LC_21850 [Undibacterium sp. JH2W]|uniref:hypothetical protein n=1 Tax=Undibacterium TaxID=401469 RepID=UPI003BF30F9F